MKWTYDWLTDYLQTDMSPEQIADILTRTGLEVDSVSEMVVPVAAKIVDCQPITGSDHLHVLQVDDGVSVRQVVCGAPNARIGLISALAKPGCVIQGREIRNGKLRGVESNGMMCSGFELGINTDNSGIIELPDDTELGSSILEKTIVFEAGITPNRPDYLSVRGIAHDLSVCGAGKYVLPEIPSKDTPKSVRQAIIETDKCAIYRFCEISDITVRASVQKIAARLTAIGINPKNAPIDTTNYICYDMGQPMHCFDADEVYGNIKIRMAIDGEDFTDLFGNTHKLTVNDIVIADDNGVLALAGVIGGARGCTTDNTKNIILESAYFDPVSVRKTSKRFGISTDASYRYERGIDPTISGIAMHQAIEMITDLCGGKITGCGIAGQIPLETRKITYTPGLLHTKTGVDIPTAKQREILENLGYNISDNGDVWEIIPTSARVDIEIPENIVAELMRIYGYDKMATSAKCHADFTAKHNAQDIDLKLKLAARGLNECKSFGFGDSKVEALLFDKPSIMVANPITSELNTARNTLLGNMLTFVVDNEKRGYPDLNLFELGTVFDGNNPKEQHTQICIVRTGDTSPKHWQRRNRSVDVYDTKADIIALLNNQNFDVQTDNAPRWAHPFRYGRIVSGDVIVAEFGELHPSVARAMKIKTNVCIAIVDDISVLPKKISQYCEDLSDFQPIKRDFAFIVDTDTPADKLVSVAAKTDSRIKNIVVFDTFDMGNGKKSVAFTITIIPHENMTDVELLKMQDNIITAVSSECGAIIRDK